MGPPRDERPRKGHETVANRGGDRRGPRRLLPGERPAAVDAGHGERGGMAVVRAVRHAFGAPGIAPRWTQSAKDAIGTAYSAGSTVWFTVSAGILNEAYYPTIDRPQIRD